jgi:hypothetical protein
MKGLILLLCLQISTPNATNINALRQYLQNAYTSKLAYQQLVQQTQNYNEASPALLLAYKAMAEIMSCKYVFSPMDKLIHFNKGKHFIETAIGKDPNNAELHYLRFTIQDNAPALLCYKSNLLQDKSIILNYIKQMQGKQDEVADYMKHYISISSNFTLQEKKSISNAL